MAGKASVLLGRGGVARSGERGKAKMLIATVARVFINIVAARGHWLVPLIMGLLLGRATVLGTMQPFGTAYAVALAAVGLRARALIATVGAIVGLAVSAPVSAGVEPLPVLIVAWCVTAAAGRYFRLSPPITAFGALLGIASLRIVAAAFSGDDFVLAALATAVDMLALVIMFPFVGLSAARPAELTRGQISSVLIVLGLLVLGTNGIYIYGYSLTELLMRVGLLVAAAVGGIGVGAAAGATMGMLSVLGAGVPVAGGITTGGAMIGGVIWTAPLLSTAGLLAGLGARFGRPGAFVGLLTAHLLLSPYAPDGHTIAVVLTHCFAAGGIVALIPGTYFRRLSRRVPDTPGAQRSRQQRRRQAESAARQQLHRVARVLDDVGRELARSRQRVARRGEGGFDQFVVDVSEGVCAGCSHHAVCWDTYVYQTYRDLLSTAAAVSASGTALSTDLPERLRQRCIKPEHLAGGVSRLLAASQASVGVDAAPDRDVVDDAHRADDVDRGADAHSAFDARGALAASDLYEAAPRQFAGIAGIISAVADHLEALEAASGENGHTGGGRLYDNGRPTGEGRLTGDDRLNGDKPVRGVEPIRGTKLGRKPRYRLVVDAAQAVGDGSVVSGDCFRRVDLDSCRVALVLSDGMGSGLRAAAESEAAVTMLERFLIEGFDLQFAVQTINSVLLLRSADETFATLDVCVFDLSDGTVHMMKTGAAPTFIRRGRHVDIVRADSLPVGILHAVEAATVQYRLDAGDLVVMVSDGAVELGALRGDKAEALGRALRRLERGDTHEVVDSLFKRVQSRANQTVSDDVTVVAAQLVPL